MQCCGISQNNVLVDHHYLNYYSHELSCLGLPMKRVVCQNTIPNWWMT